MTISPTHVQIGRAALGWTAQELSDRSGVSRPAIARYETGASKMTAANQAALRAALETALGAVGGRMLDDLDGIPGEGVFVQRKAPSDA